jgi:CheY-like chemotaxis protein
MGVRMALVIPRRVIVVDDNDVDLLHTRSVLEATAVYGAVETFGTRQEALAHLRTLEYEDVDAVLVNIDMPEMSGFEFLRAYEETRAGRDKAPVVMMLASSPDARDWMRAVGFDSVCHFVVKPLTVAQALALRNVIAGCRSRPRLAQKTSAR